MTQIGGRYTDSLWATDRLAESPALIRLVEDLDRAGADDEEIEAYIGGYCRGAVDTVVESVVRHSITSADAAEIVGLPEHMVRAMARVREQMYDNP